MKLTFLGATQTVTGSKFLLETSDQRILVDCGLFQGSKELRLRNWDAPPVDPESVDGIILTHAHIDHTGYLPRFTRDGFDGPVYATPATVELARIFATVRPRRKVSPSSIQFIRMMLSTSELMAKSPIIDDIPSISGFS